MVPPLSPSCTRVGSASTASSRLSIREEPNPSLPANRSYTFSPIV